jgi:RNA polymerase sigma factor for flagellar operon FliA
VKSISRSYRFSPPIAWVGLGASAGLWAPAIKAGQRTSDNTCMAPSSTASHGSERTTAATASTEELVLAHLPLVGHIVSERMGSLPAHVSRDELVSAGYTALVQASRTFDPTRGVPFGRYAATRIRGALVDELRTQDWASRSVRVRARRRDEAHDALVATLRRAPSPEELATHMGVDVAQLNATNDDLHRAVVLSLQGFSSDVDTEGLVPSPDPSPDEQLLHREQVGYLLDAVAELPERPRQVVEGYFLQERPMQEIAEELGVTESRVSQIRAEALALLKDALNTHLAPDQVTATVRPGGCVARRRESYFAAVASRSDYRTRLTVGYRAEAQAVPAHPRQSTETAA